MGVAAQFNISATALATCIYELDSGGKKDTPSDFLIMFR